ncbi:MAG: large subunit ribosomal protein L20 [Candidatus Berkelbacteria bacterium Licking1014_7]|uniref:Large ribosomal subunit protein bL20 n=1 Tax=Candidatus Berkelbacteria bacterium Licking1014_7 TaxID=2017147 RepID=A0A554LKQ9_9BACT|nr:MAG: large subunit ribosomal protein L20 [Candidatus Berkelbacteria bacterium Licking1014_7]
MRAKKSTTAYKKHKKILDKAKGYRASRSRVFRMAKQAVIRAGQYAYRDRRTKKRTMRQLWILKINAGLIPFELKYSRFIKLLKDQKIDLDRKILSQLAEFYPKEFAQVVKKVLR